MDRETLEANGRVLEFLGGLSAVELSRFVRDFKHRFSLGGLANAARDYSELPRQIDLRVVDAGDRKIQVIKRAREILPLSLKEAKEVSEGIGHEVVNGLDDGRAEEIKEVLEAEGATVELLDVR